jgi:hypothetical protein
MEREQVYDPQDCQLVLYAPGNRAIKSSYLMFFAIDFIQRITVLSIYLFSRWPARPQSADP